MFTTSLRSAAWNVIASGNSWRVEASRQKFTILSLYTFSPPSLVSAIGRGNSLRLRPPAAKFYRCRSTLSSKNNIRWRWSAPSLIFTAWPADLPGRTDLRLARRGSPSPARGKTGLHILLVVLSFRSWDDGVSGAAFSKTSRASGEAHAGQSRAATRESQL